jgi:hypothetical protein
MKNSLICKGYLNFFIIAIYLFSSSAFPQEDKKDTQLTPASSVTGVKVSLNNPICMLYAASYQLTGIKIYLLRTRDNTECTPKNFESITEIGIIQQLKTLFKVDTAHKMPIQYSAANMNFFNVDKKTTPIGGMNFFVHSTTFIPYWQLIANPRAIRTLSNINYVPFEFKVQLFYFWPAGGQVHEIVTDRGARYILSRFNRELLHGLTDNNLSSLKGYLKNLPPGWKFESRITNERIEIRASSPFVKSSEMIDEYGNWYIREIK